MGYQIRGQVRLEHCPYDTSLAYSLTPYYQISESIIRGKNRERARLQVLQREIKKRTTLLADYGRVEGYIAYVECSGVLK